MSDTSFGTTTGTQPWQSNSPSAGPQDVVIQLQGIVTQLSNLVAAIKGRISFGTFTLAAATTTTISDPAILANSTISLNPTNASAATLQGSVKSLYYTIVPGTSFTLHTANTTNAAGTETFSYTIQTPT